MTADEGWIEQATFRRTQDALIEAQTVLIATQTTASTVAREIRDVATRLMDDDVGLLISDRLFDWADRLEGVRAEQEARR